MKSLLLMRHAKSSWKQADLPDHERPLNKRGKKDVPLMGSLIKEKELVPQKIMFSSALRSVETAKMLKDTSGFTGELDCLDSFYMAEPGGYVEPLQSLPDEIECVMVIGHNPGLEGLLQILSGQILSLTAGAVAHIVLPVDHWNEVSLDCEGELVETFSPHDIEKKVKKEKKGKGKKPHKRSKS
jgi:phosphohistidine phosphatase